MPPPPQHPADASLPTPDDVAVLAEAASSTAHDPYVALRNTNYFRYFTGNAFSLMGGSMANAVLGYELFLRTRSYFMLGMIGLVQVIPILLLALPAGFFIDRFNRKTLILAATALQIVLWILMGFSSRFADTLVPGLGAWFHVADSHAAIMLALLLINGIARAVNQPAKQTLLPMLVPARHFHNAITWNASLFETSSAAGPLLFAGGLLALQSFGSTAAWSFAILYWANAACQLVQWFNIARIEIPHTPPAPAPGPSQSMFQAIADGVRFVYREKVILSAISLDMFAVLLGGATALLPAFAVNILHVGPLGFGGLRAAPSVGAVLMALITAHMPPMKHAGRNLLFAVTGFGAAIIVFGLSRNYWLSLIALFATGLFDNVSVVVRHSLVQLLTPDRMRGRVNSVNTVFISSSNEFGEFESGATADLAQRFCQRFFNASVWGPPAMLGPELAVVAGGAGTILVVIAAAWLWPELARIKRLDQVTPTP